MSHSFLYWLCHFLDRRLLGGDAKRPRYRSHGRSNALGHRDQGAIGRFWCRLLLCHVTNILSQGKNESGLPVFGRSFPRKIHV
jgi:hypothetical protein